MSEERMPQAPFMQVQSLDGSTTAAPAHHLASGRALLQAGRFQEAVGQFTLVLAASLPANEEYAALLERSGALLSLARRLRETPAAHSERNAVYGLDSTHLAQLALRDATRASAMDAKLPAAHLQQGRAHALLEQYSKAEAAFMEGLAADPGDAQVQQELRQLSPHLAGSAPARTGSTPRSSDSRGFEVERGEDMDCILCLKLLYEPVTTPCGHTFCRPCFMRASDHSSKCPLCRTVLHTGRELPVTVTLKNILQRAFAEEYAQRNAEESSHSSAAEADEAPVPLFVMSCLLPGERMALNIFEPRYRLMVRRCMEGNRCFGMATVGRNRSLSDVGCRAEIMECQPLPDGRFHLEIVGRSRFRIASSWEQDGYRMAQPQPLRDEPVVPESPAGLELSRLCQEVAGLADQWTERIRSASAQGQHSMALLEMLARAGSKPAAARDGCSHAEALSFWVANLLPVAQGLRLAFARMSTSAERLQAELGILQQDTSGAGCRLM